MRTTKIFISILTAIWLFGLAPEGFPQDYPTKAIRLIVPYAAGGGTDVLARHFVAKIDPYQAKENRG